MTVYYSTMDLKYLEERRARAALVSAAAEEPKRSGKIADDSEGIARRLKELEAEKQLALTGSSASPIRCGKCGSSGMEAYCSRGDCPTRSIEDVYG